MRNELHSEKYNSLNKAADGLPSCYTFFLERRAKKVNGASIQMPSKIQASHMATNTLRWGRKTVTRLWRYKATLL